MSPSRRSSRRPAASSTCRGAGSSSRDSGGDGPALLLLHGWMVSADLNWIRAYDALAGAGYRVLALDHRGHGRGLRTPEPFRLADCAGDAAALCATRGSTAPSPSATRWAA